MLLLLLLLLLLQDRDDLIQVALASAHIPSCLTSS